MQTDEDSHPAIAALNVDRRPSMPPIRGATDADRRRGKHLAVIHRHYRQEMSRVAAVLARVAAGDSPPEELKEIILSTDTAQNLRAVGTICGQQCKVLTMHHNIEEHSLFGTLESQGNTALQAVVAKLREEHLVIHDLLIRLEEAADILSANPNEASFQVAHDIFRDLSAAIKSHFGYEETELAEAIGHYIGAL